MATYLYGIVRRPERKQPWGTGVGRPPGELRLVTHRDIAAVVSDIGGREPESEGRALRRDLRAHEEVVRRAMEFGTVLPVSFGTVFEDDAQLVSHLLEPEAEELRALLDDFDDLVELTLKVDYVEEAIIRLLLEQDPELRAWKEDISSGATQDRVSFGEALSAAIEEQGAAAAERLLATLEPLAQDVRPANAGRGVGVVKASFLVDRKRLKRFDDAIEALALDAGGLMAFEYVGPLPPYSFINLSLGPATV